MHEKNSNSIFTNQICEYIIAITKLRKLAIQQEKKILRFYNNTGRDSDSL